MTEPLETTERVVVERSAHSGHGRYRRRIIAWTEHMADCWMLERHNSKPIAAPPERRPHTTDCQFCSPNGEHRRMAVVEQPDGRFTQSCRCGLRGTGSTYDAARNKLSRLHRDKDRPATTRPDPRGHTMKYRPVDGGTEVTCTCGETATAASYDAARLRLYRRHRRDIMAAGDSSENVA